MNNKNNDNNKIQYFWVSLRLVLGWLFFWAFLDKLFGLGLNTKSQEAWIKGGSPTFGFLKFAAKGPFAEIFQSLAGSQIIEWLFMLGLLFVGLSLLLGIMVRLASYVGMIMVALIYLSLLWPDYNPFVDEHVIEFVSFWGLSLSDAGGWFGLGRWWAGLSLIKKYPWLD